MKKEYVIFYKVPSRKGWFRIQKKFRTLAEAQIDLKELRSRETHFEDDSAEYRIAVRDITPFVFTND